MEAKMTQAEYHSWCNHHFLVFGLKSAPTHYVDTWRSWYNLFAVKKQASLSEMVAATNEAALSSEPPNFPREHLGALMRALAVVRDDRRIEATKEANDKSRGTDGPRCMVCDDTGIAVVPCLARWPPALKRDWTQRRWLPERTIRERKPNGEPGPRDGVEIYLTMSVRCTFTPDCRGHNMLGMSLDQYQRHFPNWMDERDRVTDMQVEAARAEREAEGIPGVLSAKSVAEKLLRNVQDEDV